MDAFGKLTVHHRPGPEGQAASVRKAGEHGRVIPGRLNQGVRGMAGLQDTDLHGFLCAGRTKLGGDGSAGKGRWRVSGEESMNAWLNRPGNPLI